MKEWQKTEYSLSKDFTFSLIDALESLSKKAKTDDEKGFILDLTEYLFTLFKNEKV